MGNIEFFSTSLRVDRGRVVQGKALLDHLGIASKCFKLLMHEHAVLKGLSALHVLIGLWIVC